MYLYNMERREFLRKATAATLGSVFLSSLFSCEDDYLVSPNYTTSGNTSSSGSNCSGSTYYSGGTSYSGV